MKVSPFPAILFVLPITLVTPALAVDSTPSASPNDEVITENLKARLIETINEITPGANNQPLGYVGRVRDIVQDTIVIEDKSGKKNVLISSDSNIVRSPGNAAIKLENVRIDDGIIAIGDPLENDSEIKGKRIIVSESPFLPPSKTSGIAKITKISKNSLGLTTVSTGNPVTLDTTSKTVVKSSENSLELSDLSEGDTVIYSALVSAKDPTDLTATVILRIATAPSPAPEEN